MCIKKDSAHYRAKCCLLFKIRNTARVLTALTLTHCAGAPKTALQRDVTAGEGKAALSWVDEMDTCVNNNTDTHKPQGYMSSAGNE